MKRNYLILVLLLQCIVAQAQYDIAFTPKQPLFSSMYQTDSYKSTFSKEDRILGNGIFLDFMLGGFLYTQKVFNNNTNTIEDVEKGSFTLGLRFGSKWYFGTNETFKTGLGVKWIDFRLTLTGDEFAIDENFLLATALLSVGSANAIKFNESSGLEINFYICPTLLNDIENGSNFLGYAINPCIKFRYKKLSVGIDMSYVWANNTESLDEILEENILQGTYLSLVTGIKF